MKHGIFIIIAVILLADNSFAKEIKKVKSMRIENQMVFEYDIIGDMKDEIDVEIAISTNGKTYTSDDLRLKGDYGKVKSGKSKKIYWNFRWDFPEGIYTPVYWEVFEKNRSFKDPVSGMEFVYIKGGCFQMGDIQDEGGLDEKPVHEVCVDNFYIGKYEVTNEEFRKFNPYHNYYKEFILSSDRQPVVYVSWDDSVSFAKWLSEKTGIKYRLPTEAEWEYAARGGTKTSRFWGDSPDDACKYANIADKTAEKRFSFMVIHDCDDGYMATSPVGSFKPNGFGLYDMLGNVWEWVSDWYGESYYKTSPKNNPYGPDTGVNRVIRGGSWFNEPMFVRSSCREHVDPSTKDYNIGFRLVFPASRKSKI